MGEIYYGSTLLTPIGKLINLPLDQVNFIVCQFIALALGPIFRSSLGPHRVSAKVRHIFTTSIGIAMMWFCFGSQMLYVLGQSAICFLLMNVLPSRVMPAVVLVAAVAQLSVCHLWRQIYHYRGTAVNISASMMINTQRITSLAWGISDGEVKDENNLPPTLKPLAVKIKPTLLEFLSYTFNFHSTMVGPVNFYSDYIRFVEGKNLEAPVVQNGTGIESNHHQCFKECPSPSRIVMKKMATFAVCALLLVFVYPLFPISYIAEVVRSKYYLAWTLGEAVNNNAGFGFYINEKGEKKWDLLDNIYIGKVEFATNMKMITDNWNMKTGLWLRYVAFERAPFMKTESVFILTTLWHGFYPGYFLCALTAVLFIIAARVVRRMLRNQFQTSNISKWCYDLLTILATKMVIPYMAFPFVYLEWQHSWEVYRGMYFFLHILAIAVILISSFVPHKKQDKKNGKAL